MSVKIIVIEAADIPTAMAALQAALAGAGPASPLPLPPPAPPPPLPLPPRPLAIDLPPVPAAIMEKVCCSFAVQAHQLVGPSREGTLFEARTVFSMLCREWTRYSLEKIGTFLSRDHTTIMHGIQMAQKRRLNEPHFANIVAAIEESLSKCGIVPTPAREKSGAPSAETLKNMRRENDPDPS